jgi:hypothetical protein
MLCALVSVDVLLFTANCNKRSRGVLARQTADLPNDLGITGHLNPLYVTFCWILHTVCNVHIYNTNTLLYSLFREME